MNAIELSTSMWGGINNVIVPTYLRRPVDFRDADALTGREIVRGYIENADPDYIIEMNPGIGQKFGFTDKVLSINAVHRRLGSHSLRMETIYESLFKSQFQFVQKKKTDFCFPEFADFGLKALGAAISGHFSEEPLSLELKEQFLEKFDAEQCKISNSEFVHFQSESRVTPLRLTKEYLREKRVGHGYAFRDSGFFILDPNSLIDVIEFWNLRSFGWQLIAIPELLINNKTVFQCCENICQQSLDPFFRKRIVTSASSVDSKRVRTFYRKLSKTVNNLKVIDLPRVWNTRWKEYEAGTTISYALEQSLELLSRDGKVVVETAIPEFFKYASKTIASSSIVNVFLLHSNSKIETIASVYPFDLEGIGRLLGLSNGANIRTTSEGFAFTFEPKIIRQEWKLPEGEDVFQQWLKQNSFEPRVDINGKAVKQIIKAVGGIEKLDIFQNRQILELLEGMARVRTAYTPKQQWMKALSQLNPGKTGDNLTQLRRLLDIGVLAVGLVLQCDNCEHSNWYAPDDIKSVMECAHCFERIKFPSATAPRESDWKFRSKGVFTLDKFAQGCYSVALTIKFLGHALYGDISWMPSFKISDQKQVEFEVDFGLFWRKTGYWSGHERLVLGECKSFNDFEQRDFSRVRKLFKLFPSSYLVLATLKDSLTPAEIRAVRKIVTSIKSFSYKGQTRAALIVLTGKQLFSCEPFPASLRTKGQTPQDIRELYEPTGDDLIDVCLVTQQVNLGIPLP